MLASDDGSDNENSKTLGLMPELASAVPVQYSRFTFHSVSGDITVSGVLVALILIISGLIFVFFGHKLFRTVLFISGFYILGMN